MRARVVVAAALLALLASAAAAHAGGNCAGHVVLRFPVTAPNAPGTVPLGTKEVLRVEATEGGWQIAVVDRINPTSRGNLLAPSLDWRDPQPFQVTPATAGEFPAERLIPLRDSKETVCIRLFDARVDDSVSPPRYTAGTVEVLWSGKQR